ncbi:ActS/PrrB/RegB family redox-sensitive histidine kinase [uncultured Albimonas sp.]|uniref:ActS/PrrB/RegB family redox-sensitive histidine kinase n=1 Tax=uncultured Albimonas sp. TaxID=1331701 RepID=UPI0030EF9F5B
MADGLPFGIPARGRVDWVRLRTLTSLRWLAALGQGAAVLFADLVLEMELPIGACFGAIAASVSLNIVAEAVHAPNKRLSERGVALTLLFDLAQLGMLLFLTGGLTNPFALLMLAPVIVSATALSLRSTLVLGLFAAAEISLLSLAHVPLVFADGSSVAPPPLIVVGSWVAMMTGLAFVAGYARRVTAEMWTMTQALGAAQEALGREQRLTAIGGLAAAAAHELGTPLATIKLVTGELARELRDQPELHEDVELIRQQAERCREILRELSATGKDDRQVRTAPIYRLVEEAAGPHRDRGKRVILRLQGRPLTDPPPPQPEAMRRPEVIHGLRNLVQNAVDFAEASVWIDIDWNDRQLRIAVGDDGPGFGGDMLGRLGDPFVRARMRPAAGAGGPSAPATPSAATTSDRKPRPPAGPAADPEADASPEDARAGYEGMGLGLFIAKTLLERTGARVSFANGGDAEARAPDARDPEIRLFPETARAPGAVVEAVWPRGALDLPEGRPRGPLGENEPFSLGSV